MSNRTKVNAGAAAYLRFLNLVEAVRGPAFPQLDTTEERLLNTLGAAWHAGKRVTVMEAMNMLPETSSATVHRRLNALRDKGLLSTEHDAHDSRIKYLVPSRAALDYFAEIGRCFSQAQGT
jgi:hypothetical protein